jgi:hypothetical protein
MKRANTLGYNVNGIGAHAVCAFLLLAALMALNRVNS